MKASLIALLVVMLLALTFVGFLVADYWSRQSVQDRARRKRRRERRRLRKEAAHGHMTSEPSGSPGPPEPESGH